MAKPKILFTDGEGPIVFKDLAQDIMGRVSFEHNGQLIPGKEFFAVLSFYDDYLAEVGTAEYQAGDTLALIVPHFLAHGITDEDIVQEAKDAKVCLGIEEYISGLKIDGWQVRIISTAYSQMWELIGAYLNVPMEYINCTKLDLASLRSRFGSESFYGRVFGTERQIISQIPLAKEAMAEVDAGKSVVDVLGNNEKFASLRKTLDQFYWQDLPSTGYRTLEAVRVMGGRRKIEAAQQFAMELGVTLSDIAYVGDSITDDALHARLKQEGGLPIAVNGNHYALRNARVAVATKDMQAIRPLLDAWEKDGFGGVGVFVQESQTTTQLFGKESNPQVVEENGKYHVIDPNDQGAFTEIVKIHGEFRRLVRGEATARLG